MTAVMGTRAARVRVAQRVSGVAPGGAGRIGLALLAAVVLAVVVGPWLVPHDPDALDRTAVLVAPGAEHLLGTDHLGRDQLARLLVGGRNSLLAVAAVLALGLAVGMVVGVVSGVLGGVVDTVLMRVVDVFLALPAMVLTLALLGVLGPGFGTMIIALTAGTWPGYARMARSYVMTGRDRPDVLAARLAGVGWLRAARRHLVPAAFGQLLVLVSLDVGYMVTSIAGLSFLGLGVQPPAAEWGAMLSNARLYLGQAPWLLLGPGVAIVLTVLAANLVGESLAGAHGDGDR
ncbi:ABC transporter permease [Saccharothrix xinjiangensis]|uniref:ABC transporter permease n=1 Tax=Saccharothrix xinjiangensis TaxID=204798 RepID=A0ABV9XV84_9PSEU